MWRLPCALLCAMTLFLSSVNGAPLMADAEPELLALRDVASAPKVHTRPVLAADGTVMLPEIEEDAPANPGVLVIDILAALDDWSATSVALWGGKGHWQIRANGTAAWMAAHPDDYTRVDRYDRIRFDAPSNFNGRVETHISDWATLGTKRVKKVPLSIAVRPVNDAPVVPFGARVQLSDDESGKHGVAVADIVRKAGITDVDTPAEHIGLAVWSSDAWEYSTDKGATWKPLGATGNRDARFLAPSHRLRHATAHTGRRDASSIWNYLGRLLGYAWDGTNGKAGEKATPADNNDSDANDNKGNKGDDNKTAASDAASAVSTTPVEITTGYSSPPLSLGVFQGSSVPPQTVGSVWAGYDIRSGAAKAETPYAANSIKVSDKQPNNQATYKLGFTFSERSRSKTDQLAVSVEGSYLAFSASASLATSKASESSSGSVSFVLFMSKRTHSEALVESSLNEQAKALLKRSPESFMGVHGTHYVKSRTYGCSMRAYGRYIFKTDSDASSLKQAFSAKVSAFTVDISASQSFDQMAKSVSDDYSIDITVEGDFATDPDVQFKPSSDGKSLAKWVERAQAKWAERCNEKTSVVKEIVVYSWADHPDVVANPGAREACVQLGDLRGQDSMLGLAMRKREQLVANLLQAHSDIAELGPIKPEHVYSMGMFTGCAQDVEITGPTATSLATLEQCRKRVRELVYYDSTATPQLQVDRFISDLSVITGECNQALLALTHRWDFTYVDFSKGPATAYSTKFKAIGSGAATTAFGSGFRGTGGQRCGMGSARSCLAMYDDDNEKMMTFHGVIIAACGAVKSIDTNFLPPAGRPSPCAGLVPAMWANTDDVRKSPQSKYIRLPKFINNYGDTYLHMCVRNAAGEAIGGQCSGGFLTAAPVMYGFCTD